MLKHARQIHTEFGFKKARFFVLKYLQFLPHSRHWLSFIEDYYRTYTQSPPPIEMVRTKFMRSYYSRGLNSSSKLDHLRTHYSVMETFLKPAVIAALIKGDPIHLGSVCDKFGSIYDFDISQHERYRAEGEFTLFMRTSGDMLALAALTFGLGVDANGKIVMRIGGLQGPQADNAKQLIVDTTRALHGQRPKALVLSLFYNIAEIFDAQRIECVSVRNHPLNNHRHAFLANNDVFWEENGGTRTADGNFELPKNMPLRALEAVPAKKRKEWLERQYLKAELKVQSSLVLTTWLRKP
jgi:uncharacterized protein VirK/YbjX